MQPLIQEIIFYLFAFISTLYIVHLGVYLIAANFYDIWQYRRRSRPAFGEQNDVPLVSVIIAAYNEEKGITRTLESIRKSTYPRLEVLVADDYSADRTPLLVRDYALRHPEMPLHIYRMKQRGGKGAGLNTLLRRYAHGELVMTLDADSVLRSDAVTNTVTYFTDPTIAGVAANVRIMDDPTVLGVLQKFEHMVGYRSKKMYSLFNCEFVVGGVASTYRMDVLRRVGFYDTDTMTEDIGLSIKITSLGNRAHRMVYAADVVAMTEGVTSLKALIRQRFRWKYGSFQNLVKYRRLLLNPSSRYSRTLTLYRMPMALISEFVLLLAPIAWGYVLYITLTQYTLRLVIGAYATITLYMLLTIWLDENLHTTGRLRLSGYALVSYFLFLIMDFVQLVDILKCLRRSHALLQRQPTGSVWTPPARSGRRVRHVYET